MTKVDFSASTGAGLTARRRRWQLMGLMVLTASLAVGSMKRGGNVLHAAAAAQSAGKAAARPEGLLPGTAGVSGTVTASKPFKAAQVYFRNPQKRMTYMVYTAAGKFRAVDLLPGDYEVAVAEHAEDLEADMQKVTLKAGENPTITLDLHDATRGSYVSRFGGPDKTVKYLTYDEMYPPGAGRDVIERTCITCHGENWVPNMPGSADWWHDKVDITMMGTDLWKRPASAYPEGFLNFRNTSVRFSREDHDVLMSYLVKNFGHDAPRRAVKTVKQTPIDEAELAKAEFIEYEVIPDPPGQGSQAPEYVQIGFKGRRVMNDVRFDAEGNVWGTDRSFPCRLVKLDPPTGDMKDYDMPEPTAEIHDFIIDRSGILWLPQHSGAVAGGPQRLWGFNPKTERFEYAIDMDPTNYIRFPIKWMQSLALTSNNDIVTGWFMGGALSIWHRAENRVTVHPIPETNVMVYGVVTGQNDIAYAVEYDGKIAALDTKTAKADGIGVWTQYTPPHYPGQIRRPNVDYQGRIMYGEWAGGPKIPGAIGVINPKDGEHTRYEIPEQTAQPYDENPDPDGYHIWFADSPTPDRAAEIGRLNSRDGKFTFYPRPQFTPDTPKIQVTRDGAVWFANRGFSPRAIPSMAVLYPDKSKITELRAFYLNGPPGYPFKVPAGRVSTSKGAN